MSHSACAAAPAPSEKTSGGRAVPARVAEVLSRDGMGVAEGEGFGAQVQVETVIRSLEGELSELNGEYARAVAELRNPTRGGEEASLQAQLRALVLRMEHKSSQLSALRRTHQALSDKVGAVRDELRETRGALAEAAETAEARYRRIRELEGEKAGHPHTAAWHPHKDLYAQARSQQVADWPGTGGGGSSGPQRQSHQRQDLVPWR